MNENNNEKKDNSEQQPKKIDKDQFREIIEKHIKRIENLRGWNQRWHISLTLIATGLTTLVTILGVTEINKKYKNCIKILIGTSGALSVGIQTIGQTFDVKHKKEAYFKSLGKLEGFLFKNEVTNNGT